MKEDSDNDKITCVYQCTRHTHVSSTGAYVYV